MIAEPFPSPDAQALAVSDALVARIREEVDRAGGWLGFDRFMQMALYEPGLGYYSAGAAKLGPGGDFVTAPELGSWLGRALAAFFVDALPDRGSPRLLEIGAGSGSLAGQVLDELAARGVGEARYAILEIGADLRRRQMERLAQRGSSVCWLDALPEPGFSGIVLANEVADALPVTRFVKTENGVQALGVICEAGRLAIAPGPADPVLDEAVERIEAALDAPLPDGYRSEVCLRLRPWLAEVLGTIAEGGMLLVDYGLARRDYYRPERSDGTLICHFRHRAHSDPLLWPGLQDLTAWVDFSAVADAAREAGFTIAGYTTQAQFMLESFARDPTLAANELSPRQASHLKTLVLPGEMGERFKLIWLTKSDQGVQLPGRDFRGWL